jgi:protein SCO1/2
MTTNALVRNTVVSIVLLIAMILGGFVYQHLYAPPKFNPQELHATYLSPARPMPTFELTDIYEKTLRPSHLIGQWSFLFFGFTQCHSICPATMAELHQMNDILRHSKEVKKLPVVYMISLDPSRDTPNSLKQYVKGFDKDFMGGLGTPKMIQSLTQQLGVVYDTQVRQDGQIDHSGSVTVVNPAGDIVAFFTPPLHAQEMAEDFIKLSHQYDIH